MKIERIFVDADSCAKGAKSIILKSAQRKKLKVIYVANKNIPFEFQSELFEMKICPETEGAADDYIVENASENTLVITRDIPLAERLVTKKIKVINDRGKEFTEKNIAECMAQRNLSLQMRQLGISTGGKWNSYCEKDVKTFADSFERLTD